MIKFALGKDHLKWISAKEYLADSPACGHEFSMPGYNMTFYTLNNCVSFGKEEQTLFPLQNNAGNAVFAESYRQHYSLDKCWNIYHTGLRNSVETLDEAVPLYPVWATNFWHWIFESLPILLLLEQYGYTGTYIVPNRKFILELLELFAIPIERIKFSGPVYVIKKITMPMRYNGYDLTSNLTLVDLVRQKLLEVIGSSDGEKCTYIKRINSRKIQNEEELLDILKKYDFDVVVPEAHSVKQQFRLMTNSVLSLMPHGANTALTLVAPVKSTLIELFGFSYVNYTNKHIIKLLQLLYIPVPEKIRSAVVNGATHATDAQDITVDVELLDILLNNFLRTTRADKKQF